MDNADVGRIRTFRYNFGCIDLEGLILCTGSDNKR